MIKLLRQVGFHPRACAWELTLACNMCCKHCGSHAGQARAAELTVDQCLDVADQLAALGCRRVTLSGGEPTLHPAWDRIGARLTSRGARVNLISNGWNWTERHVEQAQAAGLCAAAFSIDGWDKQHDLLRRDDSFRRAVAAVDACVARGLPVSVNTTISKLNLDTFHELRPFLIEHGVFSWQLQIATPTGNMGQHRDLVISPADFIHVVPRIAELCRQNNRGFCTVASDDIGYYGLAEQDLRGSGGDAALPFWIGCRAGCQVIGIESDGTVKGCLSLPSSAHGETRFIEGNVTQSSLAEIWGRARGFAYNRDFTEAQLGGFCRVCRFREYCRGGCSWTVFANGRQGVGNENCFYYQAVRQRRYDLLDEEPTPPEVQFFASGGGPGDAG